MKLEKNERILVVICGSIAAYRSIDFLRQLMEKFEGDYEVLLTRSARQFVGEKTLETFLGKKLVSDDNFSEDHLGTEHIDFARRIDRVLVYGATAQFLSDYRLGQASTFMQTQLLAFEGPVHVMPAMNPSMWAHPATQENVSLLQERGVDFWGPVSGKVACGESGVGHLMSHEDALKKLTEARDLSSELENTQVLLSMGGMKVKIDPVRSFQNFSSGTMGLFVLKALLKRGARVTVICGEVDENVRQQLQLFVAQKRIVVEDGRTPESYEAAYARHAAQVDGFVSAAAVFDFQPEYSTEKIDRREMFADQAQSQFTMGVKAVTDFTAKFGAEKREEQWLVTFSAESEEVDEVLVSRAMNKAQEKQADLVFVNRVSESSGPGQAASEAWMIFGGSAQYMESQPKPDLAELLVQQIVSMIDTSLWGESRARVDS